MIRVRRWGTDMQDISASHRIFLNDPTWEVRDDAKMHLVDRTVIFEAVSYLRDQGFDAQEVERCLVRFFYVDLDLLSEALTEH
jgi:hypothetical protein